MRLLERLLMKSRPPKYAATSTTIATKITRDGGKVLWCIAIIEEYICNGNPCQPERAG